MNLGEKIAAFINLDEYINRLIHDDHNRLFLQVSDQNPWFIAPFIKSALAGISRYLQRDLLEKWIGQYPVKQLQTRKIGLILAGNIPFVGFHDLLSVLITGYIAHLKLSHQDQILMTHLVDKLLEIEPRFKAQIQIVSAIENVDAIIASGSDNSARYFNSYYRDLPHLIRKNRTSIAVLDGHEGKEDLLGLADDIFLYFGMGCRNVSKIFVPVDYDLESFCPKLESKHWIENHEKYYHNYIYQKSLAKTYQERFYDGKYYLLKKSEKLVSPISVVFYSRYTNNKGLSASLMNNREKIQTIVSGIPQIKDAIPFGKAQYPDLWDYADQVDTLNFLQQL